jgi:hypothetical protein
MKHSFRWIVALVLIVAALQLAACASTPAATEKIAPSKVEPIEGSDFKRVVLTEKAAERIGIQTVAVRTEPVTRTRKVGAIVVDSPASLSASMTPASGASAIAQTAEQGPVWVRVRLSPSDLNLVDRAQPARVLRLADDDEEDDDDEDEDAGLEAELEDDLDEPFEGDLGEAAAGAGSASLYYVVNNPPRGEVLVPGQPVFVQLVLAGSGETRTIVPFAAVLYGVHGETWVYTTTEPLVFVRQPIAVDYIEGDLAYLSEGPPVGTQVVTVGGSLLYGAETGVSK